MIRLLPHRSLCSNLIITFTNAIPSHSHESLLTTSANGTLISRKLLLGHFSFHIPGLCDVAIIAYSKWKRSNEFNKVQKVEY
jgi:hypothetical protein